MNVEDFRGKKVLIFGLGSYNLGSGVSAALFFTRAGADVTVTDLKSAEDLKENMKQLEGFDVKYVLGEHRMKDVEAADIIIQNPGVRADSEFMVRARELGKQMENDISLFLQIHKGPVLGVTGTRGKSTTASVLWEMVRLQYPEARLAGNIKISPLSLLEELKGDEPIVLELSSWQLQSFREHKFRLPVAVLTNIMDDHMNMYASEAEYIDDKRQIFAYQKKGDVLVVNADNKKAMDAAKDAPGEVRAFSVKDGLVLNGKKIADDLQVPGEHNVANVLAAAYAADAFGIEFKYIKKAAKAFTGIEHRLQTIGYVDGKRIVSDCTSTTPDALIAAVEAYPGAVIIAGGMDKELPYEPVADVEGEAAAFILIPGTAGDKLEKVLKKSTRVETLEQAMEEALKLDAETIVFSPGAASFNMFKNEFDRADKFTKLVTGLPGYAAKG